MSRLWRHLRGLRLDYALRERAHFVWCLRQLLPLHYRTRYTETATGQRHFVVWRMWLGRCFAIDDVVIATG